MNAKLSPLLQVVYDILKSTKPVTQGLHTKEISEIALSQNNNFGLSAADFQKKIEAALASNVKNKTPSFVKPKNSKGQPRKGYYAVKQIRKASVPEKTPPKADTLFTGKAGEYAVASRLFRWQFNVSLMAVDRGIDLVAERDGKYCHIQVKTCALEPKENTFTFSIPSERFHAIEHLDPWYVFVMFEGNNTDFAVIPHKVIRDLIISKKITERKTISFKITKSSDIKQREFKLNDREITQYVNDFSQIHPTK